MRTLLKITLMLIMISNLTVLSQLTEYKNNLNGEVKRVVEHTEYMTSVVQDYNKAGFLTSMHIYNGETLHKDSLRTIERYNYKFDNKNRISEVLESISFSNKDKYKQKKIFRYKPKYYTIKELYKEDGRWVSDRFVQSLKSYTNTHIEYKTVDILEGGMFHEYYKWNKDKTLLLQTQFETDETGWDEYVCNYRYNEKDLLIYKEHKTQVDTIYDIKFSQDTIGEIDHQYIFNSTKSKSFAVEYKYDINDNCIEEKVTHHDGSICVKTYKYIYDNQGNWIERREYIDSIFKYSTNRKITYFS